MESTSPKLFIIESLTLEDERQNRFEGYVLQQILNLAGIKTEYYYIRTKKELVEILQVFKKSSFRYLHLSCHGTETEIQLTFDGIEFKEFGDILDLAGFDNRRLFLSSCLSANENIAKEIIPKTNCYSIVGSSKEIEFDSAAIFWASFYQQMYRKDDNSMKQEIMKEMIYKLSEIFELEIRYYSSSKSSQGWEEVILNKNKK